MDVVNSIVPAFASIAAAIVAYFAYRFQVRSKDQEWYTNFNELYAEFWSDPDMATVRAWIACSDAYSKVEPILRKRLDVNEVSVSEYQVLEKLDKFCSLMIRIVELTPDATNQKYRNLLQRLYFSFWIENLEKREYLRQYVEKLWSGLLEARVNEANATSLPVSNRELRRNKRLRSTK